MARRLHAIRPPDRYELNHKNECKLTPAATVNLMRVTGIRANRVLVDLSHLRRSPPTRRGHMAQVVVQAARPRAHRAAPDANPQGQVLRRSKASRGHTLGKPGQIYFIDLFYQLDLSRFSSVKKGNGGINNNPSIVFFRSQGNRQAIGHRFSCAIAVCVKHVGGGPEPPPTYGLPICPIRFPSCGNMPLTCRRNKRNPVAASCSRSKP